MASRRRVLAGSLYDLRRQIFATALGEFRKQPVEPADAVQRLGELNTLIETHESLTRRSRRLVVLASLAVASAVVIVAHSRVVTSARIELRVSTTELTFRTQRAQPLSDLIAMTDVAIAGLANVDGPIELGFHPGVRAFRLQSSDVPVVLEPVQIPAGTTVTLARTQANRYRLTMKTPASSQPFEVAVSIDGTPKASVQPASQPEPQTPYTFTFKAPQQLLARWSAGSPATVAFSSEDLILTRPAPVDELRFERIEQVGDYSLNASTLRGGEVVFPDYERRTVTVPESERLTFEGLTGIVRGVAVKDDALAVTFTGSATGVNFGDADPRHSQLPSVLDYVTSRSQWLTVGSTIGALFTLFFAVWSWWRDTE